MIPPIKLTDEEVTQAEDARIATRRRLLTEGWLPHCSGWANDTASGTRYLLYQMHRDGQRVAVLFDGRTEAISAGPSRRCSVVGCNKFGTEHRTPDGFAAPEHLCAEHAAAYDAAEDKSDFVASKMVY